MSYFNEQHEQLRQEVRAFIAQEITPYVEQWEREGSFPKELYKKLGDKGYLGLRYPKAVGGQGLDYFSVVVFVEELSRCGCGGVPLSITVQTDMATPPIAEFGSDYHIENFVKPTIRGEKVGAIGITEPNHGSNVAGIQTRARLDGDEYVINGSKMFITNGTHADFITLVTRTNDTPSHKGISLIVVELDRPGVTIAKKLDKLGMRSSDTAEIIFENVRVPKENLLGQEGTGFSQIMWELQGERMVAAPLALGMATYIYEQTKEALEKRSPVLDKQYETLAEMYTTLESAKAISYAVAEQFNQGKIPSLEISMVKYTAGRAVIKITELAMDILGVESLAFTNPIQRTWRDTRVNRIGGGADEIMKEIIAKQLQLEVYA
ncbi:acyl-CoA dehydrogenase family protein [Lysinibacillus sp. LZ02]|uniref:acyl-CoA dehydrogenase family protein n=1 Tax=Lysinibacillus sp. LZ02 TaxID=3420668 RepID=UPI003D36DA87